MVTLREGSVVVVVVVVVGSAVTRVVVVVVSDGSSVVVTTTVGGTVTVACHNCVPLVWASSAGRNISGMHRAMTTRAAPSALSAFLTLVTSQTAGDLRRRPSQEVILAQQA